MSLQCFRNGNPKYGVTKSYGLFVCRKSLENVKSARRHVNGLINSPRSDQTTIKDS